MVNFAVFKKLYIFTAKGIAWILYALCIDYIMYNITMYFLRDTEECDECGGDFDTVFFTEKDRNCWMHICTNTPCGEECAYLKIKKILGYMERAGKSLDVCIYHLTSYDFAFGIINAFKRNVKVRVITDWYRVTGSGSQIQYLIEQGIPVRTLKVGREMHHKFFIVDGRIVVNCSFNWTMQGVAGNSEDAVIISKTELAQKFLGHFDALWDVLDPNSVEAQ